MRYHSFLSKEDSAWGEKEVIRFRWVLILAILVLITYVFLSGNVERGFRSLGIAMIYIFYNSILNILLRKFDNAFWIRYLSSTFDVTFLTIHIFNYSYFFTPIAVSTAASLFIYAILIMLSVLRYDGKLVIFTTAYVVVCYNIVYFMRYKDIDPELIKQVASSGPEGALYRSVYFILMGYFLFSIPRMINRLVEKQNRINNERRDIEIKLALETQRKEMAMQNLLMEQQLSEELNEQKKLIEKQNRKLEELNQTKDKLFSIISHDLRSPLCVQSSLSEYLIDDFQNIDKEAMLDTIYAIHKTSYNGLNLLSNLMDWSKSQSNKLDPNPQKIKLLKKTNEITKLQDEAINAKQISINSSIPDNLTVFADEQMFSSVIRNLLSNAIKFTKNSGYINIEAMEEDGMCKISISDNGIGMSEENVNKLFSLSSTITTLGTNNEKGTGLGLILCKELVEVNNGIINVESDLNKGTTFTIKLPINKE